MKPSMIAAATLALLLGNTVMAADDDQTAAFEADCRKYAQEDGVAADELKEYIAMCVQDLKAAQAYNGDGEGAAATPERD